MDQPFTVLIVNSATKNNVTYYLLQIQQDDDEEMSYAVDRRFTDFVELDEKLRSIYGSAIMDTLPQLPKKTFMRKSNDSFVKKRHYKLQQYLKGIRNIKYLKSSKTYRDFLKLESFFPSSMPVKPFLRFIQNKSQHGVRLSNFDMIMLSHNVFISIAGCHPEIAFCSPEKIQNIQLNHGHKDKPKNKNKNKHKSSPSSSDPYDNAITSSSQYSITKSPMSPNNSLIGSNPSSPLTGRIGGDLTGGPQSSMLPSPNEWGGCIQIWYYDTTAMNSGNFSWWLEDRGDDNKNFYGWNKSKATDLSNGFNDQTMDTNYSYYGAGSGIDDINIDINDDDINIDNPNPNLDKNITHIQRLKQKKRRRIKEVNKELDCIFLNEVPTSVYYDRDYQQLFVGTLMGNIHRFKIIHNQKIEATGILPNPNIYNNVSNIHSYCHSSIYNYIHHIELFKKSKTKSKIETKQRIHQRLYEQRELLKLKQRQLHHKKAKRKMALIPDNDAIYNKSILNMISFNGVLYVSDASNNIHAFEINEFKHLHYLSLDHYFVDILQTEYKIYVDEYYKNRLDQYRQQHERMMFKSSGPKDIHTNYTDADNYDFYDKNKSNNNNNKQNAFQKEYFDNNIDNDDDDDDFGTGSGSLFSFTKKNKKTNYNDYINDNDNTKKNKSKGHELQTYGTPISLDTPMRIGGIEKDTAYEMYFDELVFSTTITKQKEKILNVTNKLNQDVIVTDLISFEDNLFIATNLPYLTLEHLRYPDNFNVKKPKIAIDAVTDKKMKPQPNAINVNDNDNKDKEPDDDMNYSNPYTANKNNPWTVVSSDGNKDGAGLGCDNIFGTVANFDSNNDVLYSIPSVHTMHKDFLIYDDVYINNINNDQTGSNNDNTNDMCIYNKCTIFVWAFTTHISVDLNDLNKDNNTDNNDNDNMSGHQFADYQSWKDNQDKKLNKKTKKFKKKKKKKINKIKERSWYLKCKWYDATVDCICKEFTAIVYCQSIKTLVLSGITGYVCLFNSIGECFNIFYAHTDRITKMIWLDSYDQLVTTGLDGAIKLWKLYHSSYSHNKQSIDVPSAKHVLTDDYNQQINTNNIQSIDHNQDIIDINDPTQTQTINTQHNTSNVQYLNKQKQKQKSSAPTYKYHNNKPAIDLDDDTLPDLDDNLHRFDNNPDLNINNDDDLALLSKSRADYDPFADESLFSDYLKQKSKNNPNADSPFSRPQKHKRAATTKNLFATQDVLGGKSQKPKTPKIIPRPKRTKSHRLYPSNTPPAPHGTHGPFKTVRVNKPKPNPTSISDINIDDLNIGTTMDNIEQYIESNVMQMASTPPTININNNNNNSNNSNDVFNNIGSLHSSLPLPADMNPDNDQILNSLNNNTDDNNDNTNNDIVMSQAMSNTPPIDVTKDSSPEPQQINKSLKVTKVKKPKKKKKRRDKDKKKDKKKKKHKKKGNKDKQKDDDFVEDCTIRYEKEEFTDIVTKKLYSGASTISNTANETFSKLLKKSSNPIDNNDNNDNNDQQTATNPFNKYTDNDMVPVSSPTNKDQKNTNPFASAVNDPDPPPAPIINNNNNPFGNTDFVSNKSPKFGTTNPFSAIKKKKKYNNPFFNADDLP